MGPRTGAENHAPTWIRALDRPAHSELLHRLHYPSPTDRESEQRRLESSLTSLQYEYYLLLLLPLALQPAVGFGLSNNISPFFPILHQLSPSSHSQYLKISFYFLLNSIHSTSRAGRLLAITKIYM